MEKEFECSDCGCTSTKETIMETGPHYSRIDCAACHKFVKWGKTPAPKLKRYIIRADGKVDWTIPYDEAYAIAHLMNNSDAGINPQELSSKLSALNQFENIQIGKCNVYRVQ